MNLTDLPLLNACLNGLSSFFLVVGYVLIRKGMKTAHRTFMVAALLSSSLILVGYLYYHFHAGRTVFREPAWFRPYYLALLLSHTVLAVAIVPMVIMTVWRAARGHFEAHRRIARWTLPLWAYVSVTGVVIYLLLYQIFPQQIR